MIASLRDGRYAPPTMWSSLHRRTPDTAPHPGAVPPVGGRAATMRTVQRPPSRPRAARALLTGALLLAAALPGGGTGSARAQPARQVAAPAGTSDGGAESGNQVAFAVPRSGSGGWGGVGLPEPLSPSVAARIRHIFILQEQGAMEAAARETAALGDRTLVGDILADRYLREAAAGSAEPSLTGALSGWLQAYGDQPDARAIHAALLSRLPAGAAAPPAPDVAFLAPDAAGGTGPTPEEADAPTTGYSRNPSLDHAVRERSGAGLKGADSALRLIAHTRGLSAAYAGQLRSEVALDLFTQGLDHNAATIGMDAWRISGEQAGLGPFVAGLAAWRSGDIHAAIPRFEAAARAKSISASLRAGAALWAARAHLRAGDRLGYVPWLENAAALPHTFYGLLASRMLGRPIVSDPADTSDDAQAAPAEPAPRRSHAISLHEIAPRLVDAALDPGRHTGLVRLLLDATDVSAAPPTRVSNPLLGEIDIEALGCTPQGRRALALLQVGQDSRAEAALRNLWGLSGRDPALRHSIMLVARAAGLTGLAAQAATLIEAQYGQPVDAERFPVPHLHPAHGFTTDPALVYALTRLESNFDAGAVSGAGAHGLMQLMPVTAGYVTGDPDRFTGTPSRLHNPALNLDLGQRYVNYLAHSSGIDDNLIKLLASYNAGPNAMRSWAATSADDSDPLLFIESIPLDETRQFVRRGLSYLWIYAARMKLPCPSLDALARGAWPLYADEGDLSHQPIRMATLH